MPKIRGAEFILLTADEIQAKVNHEGRITYLTFTQFEVKGS